MPSHLQPVSIILSRTLSKKLHTEKDGQIVTSDKKWTSAHIHIRRQKGIQIRWWY